MKDFGGDFIKAEDIIEEIEDFEPETELGMELKELALRGVGECVKRLSVDEVMEYLGRPAYVEQA